MQLSLMISRQHKIKKWSKAIVFPVTKQNATKFEDLNCFIQQFMNQAASHLASRTRPQGTVQSDRFLYAERG